MVLLLLLLLLLTFNRFYTIPKQFSLFSMLKLWCHMDYSPSLLTTDSLVVFLTFKCVDELSKSIWSNLSVFPLLSLSSPVYWNAMRSILAIFLSRRSIFLTLLIKLKQLFLNLSCFFLLLLPLLLTTILLQSLLSIYVSLP